MDPKERDKMVQIRVMIKGIGMTVMSVRMLMLPHDGVAQKGHGPHTAIIDPRRSAGRVMASIMTESSHQPAKNSQKETSQNTSLDIQQK